MLPKCNTQPIALLNGHLAGQPAVMQLLNSANYQIFVAQRGSLPHCLENKFCWHTRN